jgi:hypothetical protein
VWRQNSKSRTPYCSCTAKADIESIKTRPSVATGPFLVGGNLVRAGAECEVDADCSAIVRAGSSYLVADILLKRRGRK